MKWISFDCFGTLVDWNGGFEAILREVAGERTKDLVHAYHAHERYVEREPYKRYREVTSQALVLAARDTGLDLEPWQTTIIADRWQSLPVFSDTVSALTALRKDGWKLAVLTNCDDDLFAQTQGKIGVPFDAVVTAQQVRSYKPNLEHFRRFERIANGATWVHAACSWFHDMVPASEMGIPRIWIDRDRTGDDPSVATAVLPDLKNLPETARAFAE